MNFLEIHSSHNESPSFSRRRLLAPLLFLSGILFGLFLQFQPRFVLEYSGRTPVPSLVLTLASPVGAGGDATVLPPSATLFVAEPAPPSPPALIGALFDGAKISAHGAMVRDLESSAILFEKEGFTPRPIASITKLMSALVILETQPNWSATTTVIGADGLDTHMYAGDTYQLSELWQAGLVASSNKAMMTLGSALGWSTEAFVERMNQRAQELGLLTAVFRDPTGLDEWNVASPEDVARLLERAAESREIRETLLKHEVTLFSQERKKSHRMWNTNWLLLGWIPHVFSSEIIGKTGYTTAAGYNFVGIINNGEGRVLEVVILDANSHEARFTEAKMLAEWAFENYVWKGQSFIPLSTAPPLPD